MSDPLGRIKEHASKPYQHPEPTLEDIRSVYLQDYDAQFSRMSETEVELMLDLSVSLLKELNGAVAMLDGPDYQQVKVRIARYEERIDALARRLDIVRSHVALDRPLTIPDTLKDTNGNREQAG